jgi:hypothetical protein
MLDEVRRAIDAYFPHSEDMYDGPYEFHDYPWLDFKRVSDDGREIALLIKFWAGGEFCCRSPGCRFLRAFVGTEWTKLRELLRREGVEPKDTIKLVVRVEYEAGAKIAKNPGHPDTEYIAVTESSWAEYETEESQPDRTQIIPRSSG